MSNMLMSLTFWNEGSSSEGKSSRNVKLTVVEEAVDNRVVEVFTGQSKIDQVGSLVEEAEDE